MPQDLFIKKSFLFHLYKLRVIVLAQMAGVHEAHESNYNIFDVRLFFVISINIARKESGDCWKSALDYSGL